VEEAETTQTFTDYAPDKVAKARREDRAASGASTMDRVRLADIKVYHSELKPRHIAMRAFATYNDRNATEAATHGETFEPIDFHSDPGLVERTIVNWIRHNLTNYDYLVSTYIKNKNSLEDYRLLRKRVFERMAEAIPYFDETILHQLEVREEWDMKKYAQSVNR
jgi:hypothetical protein